jgi:hypothetical protein
VTGRLWKLRQRFGIAAPKVTVRTQVAWYWRWIGMCVLLACSAALAAWIYDAGRRFAGFDRNEVEVELGETKQQLESARAELEKLRVVANASDSRLSIERTAQQRLAQQIRNFEQENARLREELAIFESMLSSEPADAQPLSIKRFKVEPEVLPGEFRYRLLLLASSERRQKDFQGRLELVVHLNENGRNAMMRFPEPADAGAAAFRIAFKYFHRIEGTFRVSPNAKVESVQVRIFETGTAQPRATQTVKIG